MVSRDSWVGERDEMQGERGELGVEFAEEGVAFLDSVPRHNVVLTRQIEPTHFLYARNTHPRKRSRERAAAKAVLAYIEINRGKSERRPRAGMCGSVDDVRGLRMTTSPAR